MQKTDIEFEFNNDPSLADSSEEDQQSYSPKKEKNSILTGRKSKKAKKVERTEYLEKLNTVIHKGIVLKKVNTCKISHKLTSYFKCPNMRTPTHVVGVCNFSGRIVEFPGNTDMEILHDHTHNCSYARGTKDNRGLITAGNKVPSTQNRRTHSQPRNSLGKSFPVTKPQLTPQKNLKKTIDFISPKDDTEGIELPNIYIQLWTDQDMKMVAQMSEIFKNIEREGKLIK